MLSHVVFTPFMSTDELTLLRKKCDICLICSKAEALGRVTVESMASGCLTIGADCGATSELICDGETGYLYKYGNSNNLAEVIEKAIKNENDSRKIAQKGQQYVLQTFDCDSYAKRIYTLYMESKKLC